MDLPLILMLFSRQGEYVVGGKDRAAASSVEQCLKDTGSVWVARWGRVYLRQPVCTMQPAAWPWAAPQCSWRWARRGGGKNHPG